VGAFSSQVLSRRRAQVSSINNLKISKVAKLAGAPQGSGAGVWLHAKIGDKIDGGSLLFTIYSESAQELQFSVDYVANNPDIFSF